MKGRLDKLLGDCLLITRKEAQSAVREGRVLVDGVPCRDPSVKADNEQQTVTLDGAAVRGDGLFYIMLYKPQGVLSATEDSRGAETALGLLPERFGKAGLGVCGRLDKDAEGLLLLTNDGALNHKITSPKSHMDKRYLVRLDRAADEIDVPAFAAGIELSDFTALPAELKLLPDCGAEVVIREGKFHQVKRMFSARGKEVVFLKRVSIGPLKLDPALQPGEWRELSGDEKRAICAACDMM